MRNTLLYMAIKNTTRRARFLLPVILCVFITVFAAVATWTTYDMTRAGMELSRQRQGADVLIYPYASELDDATMLYSGLPQSIYMDKGILSALKNDQVDAVTWQFYLQTLPASGCCTVMEEYRLVGVDWDSDFMVRPWLKDGGPEQLENGNIIVGCNLAPEIVQSTLVLNVPMQVTAVLEPTGTALDNSIILNIEQLRSLARVNFPIGFFDGEAPSGLITCALVRLNDGVSPQDYISSLGKIDAKAIAISAVQDSLQEQVATMTRLLIAMLFIIVFLCCVTLSTQFRMLTYSRCKEIGYLRTIGMNRSDIAAMLALEFGSISLLGGTVGSIAGLAAAVQAVEWIRHNIAFPMGQWESAFVLGHALVGVALALLLCAAATLFPLRRITRISPHDAITKGEL